MSEVHKNSISQSMFIKKSDGTWYGLGSNRSNMATTDSFPALNTRSVATAGSGY